MRETTPRIQRVYLRFEDAGHGAMRLSASLTPPSYAEPMLVLLSRGVMPAGQPVSLLLVSDPTQDPALRGAAGKSAFELAQQLGFTGTLATWLAGLKGRDASAYLGAVTIGQTATLAVTVAAGARRVLVTVPAAMGVVAGDSLYLAPTQVLPGYVISDVVAVDATTLSVGLTGPALAVGTSYKISCKLFRFNG